MARMVIVRSGEDSEASALAWIVAFMVLALATYVLVSGLGHPARHLRLAVDETASGAPASNQ